MLKLLVINNIALIPRLELEFGPGLSLLTGETGAGKSILIDALGLLLGHRASAELIRTGQEQASVEGVVESAEAVPILQAHGLPVDLEPEHPKMGHLVAAVAQKAPAMLAAKQQAGSHRRGRRGTQR